MNIKSFFQITLNKDQENVIQNLEDFLESKDSVFIFYFYAGTGKTTLIKGLVKALDNEKKKFLVCAPTGRASKILRNKTGYGKTIHSTIYDFDNLITINSENEDFLKLVIELEKHLTSADEEAHSKCKQIKPGLPIVI